MSLARQLARPCVLDAAPYTWVRPADPGKLLLLDANENAWEPHGARLARYPQLNQEQLRAALAKYARVSPEQVLATCGADEAIDLLVRTFCEPGEDAITALAPTYPMYARQAGIAGVRVRQAGLALFEVGDAMTASRDLADSKLVFLGRPNNPTSDMLRRPAVRAVLQAVPGFLVVDEAYIEFSDESDGLVDWLQDEPRLILVRTLSKAFGLAGIRLGYVLASPEAVEVLDLVRLPFNVNALTTETALQALAEPAAMESAVRSIRAERERLVQALGRLPDVEVAPSQTNFLLVHVPDSPGICQRLLERGILVRDRSSIPGVGSAFRVAVGRPEDGDRLLAEMARCLGRAP